MLSPIAKIVKYAENKTQNVRNQYQLALAIGKSKAFPQLVNISANYSQGMYDTIGSQINGFMQFYDNPVQTAGSSLSYFLSDPLKNNPIYGIYQYGKDFKKAVSAHDWDTASYKLGVGVVNTAEVAASIAIGGKIGGKIPTGKVSVPKVGAIGKIRNAIDNFGTPALAGANGMVISGAVPIEASISSATVASASGVVAGAAVGQNVVYSSNKGSDQLSSGIKEVHKPVSYKRPSGFRKGVRDKAWKNAKNTNGDVIDPVTQKIMNESEPWDMGHKPGFEFRKHQKSAEERGITRKQFLDEYNDPNHYRPELPSSNRSHKGEDLTDNYFGK